MRKVKVIKWSGRGSRFDEIGLSFREPTHGPEYDMVNRYIDSMQPSTHSQYEKVVFIEPQIESGFPDIVVVDWDVTAANHWKDARSELIALDLRVAHFLATVGPSTLEGFLPFFKKSVLPSLERLQLAGLAVVKLQTWRLRQLRDIYAVRRLEAIEAKIGHWREGLHQAIANTWFASESYLLLPSIPSGTGLLQAAGRVGVGVKTLDRTFVDSPTTSRCGKVPRSYASWLFNECLWRHHRGYR